MSIQIDLLYDLPTRDGNATTVVFMNNNSETKRLTEAVANLAKTITDIIELKIKELAPAANAGEAVQDGMHALTTAEGWVGKKHVAEQRCRVRWNLFRGDRQLRRGPRTVATLGRATQHRTRHTEPDL
jgi:hypothetical protein